MVVRSHEPQAAVAAGMDARLIQVDEDLGMSEGAAAAVADDHALCAHLGRHLSDQIDGELRVHLLGSLREPHQSVVVLSESLSSVSDFLSCRCR